MSRRGVAAVVAVVAVLGAAVIALLVRRPNAGPPVATAEPAAAPGDAAGPAPARPSVSASSARGADQRVAVESLEEAQLMARLRELAGRDPQRAVAVAREGNRRFPDSPFAPERTSILIHALAE